MVYASSRFPPPGDPLADKASMGPLGSLTFLSAKISFRECPLLAHGGHYILHRTYPLMAQSGHRHSVEFCYNSIVVTRCP
jgi:hypothetical protein